MNDTERAMPDGSRKDYSFKAPDEPDFNKLQADNTLLVEALEEVRILSAPFNSIAQFGAIEIKAIDTLEKVRK